MFCSNRLTTLTPAVWKSFSVCVCYIFHSSNLILCTEERVGGVEVKKWTITTFSLIFVLFLFHILLSHSPPLLLFFTPEASSHSIALIISVVFSDYFLFLIYIPRKKRAQRKMMFILLRLQRGMMVSAMLSILCWFLIWCWLLFSFEITFHGIMDSNFKIYSSSGNG